MSVIADLLPVLGLRITAGPLELRGITDDDLPALCTLAERGIHDPDAMPFHFPWTDAPQGELARNTAAYHWRARATFSVESWSLNLGVWHEGELVGTQSSETDNFLVTRTGETGSWLGRALNQMLVLRSEDLVRGAHPIHVEGLEAFRRSIGLDAPQTKEQA